MLQSAYSVAVQVIFTDVHVEVKSTYQKSLTGITDISVSFDGTWFTRGHTSLILV